MQIASPFHEHEHVGRHCSRQRRPPALQHHSLEELPVVQGPAAAPAAAAAAYVSKGVGCIQSGIAARSAGTGTTCSSSRLVWVRDVLQSGVDANEMCT
jgi:hypothetical protein